MTQGLPTKRVGWVILCLALATLGVWALLSRFGAPSVGAQGRDWQWPLTFDGRSRLAGWSPDGEAVLVSRWGRVVGEGAVRQALSELWAVGVLGKPSTLAGAGRAIRLSENAIQPAYTRNGEQLAYLAFVGAQRWEARVLDVDSRRETSWGAADWRMHPVWIGETLAFVRDGKVWLSSEGVAAMAARLRTLPPGARVRLTADGARAAWSDGRHLWAARIDGVSEEPRLLAADIRVLSFVWSPDGGQLAYVVAAEGPSPELWIADVQAHKAPVLLVEGQGELFSAPSWSPDSRTLAFSRTPMGAATASASDIWLVSADGGTLRPLWRNDLEESSPAWSPDGRYLAFNRAGDVWVLDMTCGSACAVDSLSPAGGKGQEWATGEDFSNFATPVDSGAVEPLAQQSPPDTIRVIHHPENTCRDVDVPVGQIDVITFETYVKQVVPAEMPASWASEALKAQAVAARTFGWKKVLIPSDPNWDLTDWYERDQVMCDYTERPSRTDAAVDATEGQYVAWRGNVIYAMYSAENGSPTRPLTSTLFPDGIPYLMAVDDPVSFGQPVSTHACGLSQWGAKRWAEWHGWGYQQILAHYYTDVTIELPSTGGPLPIGGVTLPWSDYFVTSNRVYIAANASDEDSAVSGVGFYALTDTATLLVTDTVGSDGWGTVWDVAQLSDTPSAAITLSVLVADAHLQSQGQSVHIGLDRQPPTDPTAAINGAYTDTMTVTLSSLSAADPSPGSGVQTMAFSNERWTWEGEELYHQSGVELGDEDALNAEAWCALAAAHSPGAWYGPYTHDLPPGHAYRAYFRLRTNDVATTAEVAMLDVVDNGGERILGLRRLRGTDFRFADTYQEFAVDFNYTDAGAAGLEFRTAFRAAADLCLDRVLIVGYPIAVATSAQWGLTPGEGLKVITIKFIDGAGNVSADLTRTVTLDTSPPTGWRDFTSVGWDAGHAPTCTVRVLDEISGLDVESARYRFSTDGGLSWSDWAVAACTGISGTTDLQTIAAFAVPFGQPSGTANRIEYQIADMAGHTGSMSYAVRSKVVYLPLIVTK